MAASACPRSERSARPPLSPALLSPALLSPALLSPALLSPALLSPALVGVPRGRRW